MLWTFANRTRHMTESALRDLLKVGDLPGIISFAGGLPTPQSFPLEAFSKVCTSVLHRDGSAALQYGPSEGYGPLRELVARQLPWEVDPSQVLITTGSQQGLALAAQVLLDEGSIALVESPTYLGALQAFVPMQPNIQGVLSDDQGVLPQALEQAQAQAQKQTQAPARFLYVQPNFQNPTGRSMGIERRQALLEATKGLSLPLVEDNPYGELWLDVAPPLPLTAHYPEGCIYLGSFSKVLAPGLRLGFMVAPKAVFEKLVQAKQGSDLHSPNWIQRMVVELLAGDFLSEHGNFLRQIYKAQRDAMLTALQNHMHGLGVQWNVPAGGMFIWLRLPLVLDARKLLAQAIQAGVAYVPGAAFYASATKPESQSAQQRASMRLCYTTASAAEIQRGIALLAQVLRQAMQSSDKVV